MYGLHIWHAMYARMACMYGMPPPPPHAIDTLTMPLKRSKLLTYLVQNVLIKTWKDILSPS